MDRDKMNTPAAIPGEGARAGGNAGYIGVGDGAKRSPWEISSQSRCGAARIQRRIKALGSTSELIIDIPEARGEYGARWYAEFRGLDQIRELIGLHPRMDRQRLRDWAAFQLLDAAPPMGFGGKC